MTRTSPEVSPRPAQPKQSKSNVVLFVLCFVGLLALVVINSGGASRYMNRLNLEGNPAPQLRLQDADTGDAVALSSYAEEGKVVVLDFWATWCPPCRKQMPIVERLARDQTVAQYAQIVSVNTDELTPQRADMVRSFLKRAGHTHVMALLDDGSASRAFNVTSIPTLVIIDRSGRVHAIQHGVHSEQALRALIDEARLAP